MSMTLRVVIPPHPLIGHWLSILRMKTTPQAIYAAGLEQLGKWLTYEALRDWMPYIQEKISAHQGETEGILINSNIQIIALPKLPGGMELWVGAREVLPNATLCLEEIPNENETKTGVIIFCDQISNGANLIKTLNQLKEKGLKEIQIRVIAAITASEGLKKIGEHFPELTIYSACIDPEIANENELIPGIGNPRERLNTRIT